MSGTCGYCRQRRHAACALTRACACRERGHGSASIDTDARDVMGSSGGWHGYAYAWCARHSHYLYVNDALRASTRELMRAPDTRERNTPNRAWRTAQPKRAVTSGSVWNVRALDRVLAPAARVSRVTALARGGFGL